MNTRILKSCIAAVVSMPLAAQAMHLAADGRGSVLIYPYYTVDGGNQTILSVVNTTGDGKAIAVRFREGSNARAALGFNLYLAPFDVWTASVFSRDGTGPANLITLDDSCTVPEIKRNTALPVLSNGRHYAPFLNFSYTGASDDSGSNELSRTREGYFELIEMGVIDDISRGSLTALRPGVDGIPVNCEKLQQAWMPGSAGYWLADRNIDVRPPTGGLYGRAAIIDTLNGTMLGYAADAVANFSVLRQHALPGDPLPHLGSGISDAGSGNATATLWLDGAPTTLTYPPSQAIDAVSALFTADSLYNDFVIAPQLGAASEWVLTFPTKSFYTDDVAGNMGTAIAPFSRLFPRSGTSGIAPADFYFGFWARDGRKVSCLAPYYWDGCLVGVPPPGPEAAFNWATNVLSFEHAQAPPPIPEPTAILGSMRRLDVLPFLDTGVAAFELLEGSMRLNFYDPEHSVLHALRPDTSGRRLRGLPVQGFWAVSYTNSAVTPGVLANYSATTRHQVTRGLLPPP